MGPVFKEQAATIHEPVEPRAVVGSEAAPHRQIVRAIEHIDRVELHAAHVLDESAKARRREWACPGPRQVLRGQPGEVVLELTTPIGRPMALCKGKAIDRLLV